MCNSVITIICAISYFHVCCPLPSNSYYFTFLLWQSDCNPCICSHVFLFPNQVWVLNSNDYLLFISIYLLARHRMACCLFFFLILNESINISIYNFSWLCDCSHEIKRCLLPGRKVMTNLDSIFKSRDTTLSIKVHLVKAMVFTVVMYGC